MKTEKTSVSRDNINLNEMFNFESTTDEDSLSAAMSSNNEGSGGQRNNTDYTESVIPGFLILL